MCAGETGSSVTSRAQLDAAISEKDFQAQVVTLARLKGWLVYHTFDSRRSGAGFPDLVCVRGTVILFCEIKSERGKLSPEQLAWRDALLYTPTEWYLWKPSDWPWVVECLDRPAPPD